MTENWIARVVTDRPERWAKQLSSHLGHRLPMTETDDGFVFDFRPRPAEGEPVPAADAAPTGRGGILRGDGVLLLTAQADDAESAERLKDVLGRHLERFGEKDGLVVVWERAD